MSKVNHKLVKQRLNEKISRISDRQFFSSRVLAGHFEDIAEVQTRRYSYNRRVRVNLFWDTKRQDYVASTDNRAIDINTGHKLVTQMKGRTKRYQVVSGIFAHELGHVLYTDFLTEQTHSNALASYRWYPCRPAFSNADDLRREREFWEYVKLEPRNLEIVQYMAHYISNVLEDGYIENRILNNFPGMLGNGLEILRKQQLAEMPTVTELIESEKSDHRHIFESIMQVMLQYAKYGEIKYGDEPYSDVRIKTVFGLLNEIDESLKTHSIKKRLGVVNLTMIRCWDYLKEFCEICKEKQKEAEASDLSAGLSETIGKILKSVVGSSEMGKGGSSAVPEAESEETMITASMRSKTKAEAEEEEKTETESDAGEAASSEAEAPETEATSGGESESEKTESEDGTEDDEKSFETKAEEGGRIGLMETTEVSVPEGGTVEHEEYKRENYDRAASDVDRILKKMAEKSACKELENERLREMNDFAKNISYGNIHSGVNIRIKRIAEVDDELIEQYNTICSPLLNISRVLQKSLKKQLEDKRRGGKQTGLLMGRRLDTHAIHRTDGKVFCKSTLPNETPELAVALLVDESGSMSLSDRCTYARAAAIILYDFCQSLEIPIAVYGHSTNNFSFNSNVELYSYAEFESFDNNDKYRLMDIRARHNNRDGAPLRYTAEQLCKRTEEIKILILISDGQPCDRGYMGTAAEEDLRGIQKEYQKKGVLFVAAAIGDDKQDIGRIYGDSFMDITDLNQLPAKLTSVVKRYIRT